MTAIHDRELARARAALGAEPYAAHFAEGWGQSPEEAVADMQDEPAGTASTHLAGANVLRWRSASASRLLDS